MVHVAFLLFGSQHRSPWSSPWRPDCPAASLGAEMKVSGPALASRGSECAFETRDKRGRRDSTRPKCLASTRHDGQPGLDGDQKADSWSFPSSPARSRHRLVVLARRRGAIEKDPIYLVPVTAREEKTRRVHSSRRCHHNYCISKKVCSYRGGFWFRLHLG